MIHLFFLDARALELLVLVVLFGAVWSIVVLVSKTAIIWIFSFHATRHAIGLLVSGDAATNHAVSGAMDHSRWLEILLFLNWRQVMLRWCLHLISSGFLSSLNLSEAGFDRVILNGSQEAILLFHF